MSEKNQNNYQKVLVLSSAYLPVNITSWRRAIILVYKGKATGVEFDGHLINNRIRLPLVVKLSRYVFIPHKEAVLSRKNIYMRDNYACQYCGKSGGNLTIDHIVPRSRGGEDHWNNMVTCCQRCNNCKGSQLLEEAGMKLIGMPYRPPSNLYLHMTRLSNIPKSWYNYFFKQN